MNFSVIGICLKKQAELLGSSPKEWNLLHQDSEICFLHNCQNEFKEFFSQETIWHFVIIFALIQRLLDTYTIQLRGVCLLTLQKLA
jgi:hypothetical protein